MSHNRRLLHVADPTGVGRARELAPFTVSRETSNGLGAGVATRDTRRAAVASPVTRRPRVRPCPTLPSMIAASLFAILGS